MSLNKSLYHSWSIYIFFLSLCILYMMRLLALKVGKSASLEINLFCYSCKTSVRFPSQWISPLGGSCSASARCPNKEMCRAAAACRRVPEGAATYLPAVVMLLQKSRTASAFLQSYLSLSQGNNTTCWPEDLKMVNSEDFLENSVAIEESILDNLVISLDTTTMEESFNSYTGSGVTETFIEHLPEEVLQKVNFLQKVNLLRSCCKRWILQKGRSQKCFNVTKYN